jgi:HK97 family phage major capsid protein
MADLLGQGQADTNAIIYIREKTFTNATTAVAEGTTKPESTLVFETVTELVRKYATWIPISDEMLEDVAQVRSYLNQRLELGVNLALDDAILNGSGVSPNMTGFVNRAGLTATQARGADTNIDAILKQISAIQAAVFVRPDGIVMHPTNWQSVLLLKDSQGRYFGDSPFSTSASTPLWGQPIAPTPTPSLWGLPVVLTPQIAVGTALIGCFKTQAMLYRRGGLRLEATNSHSDFFVKNLIAVLCELRAAMAVYRPLAFGFCSGLT